MGHVPLQRPPAAVLETDPEVDVGCYSEDCEADESGPDAPTKNDGTAWSWGSNSMGQLGDGTYTDRESPVKVQSISDVKFIEAGDDSSLAMGRGGVDIADPPPGNVTPPPDDGTVRCPTGSWEEFRRYHQLEVPGVNQTIFEYSLSVPHCKGHPDITAEIMESTPPMAAGRIVASSWKQWLITRAASYYLPELEYKYAGGDSDAGHRAKVTRRAGGKFIVSSSKSFKACTSLPTSKVLKLAKKSKFMVLVIEKYGSRISYRTFVKKIPYKWRVRIVGWLMKPVIYKLPEDAENAIKKHVVKQIEDYIDGIYKPCKTVWKPNMTATIYPDGRAVMSAPTKPLMGLKTYSSTSPADGR